MKPPCTLRRSSIHLALLAAFGLPALVQAAAGDPLGPEFQVNTLTTGFQGQPAVAIDANGTFVVAWASEGDNGNGAGIRAQRYNAAGTPQGLEFRANTFIPAGTLTQFEPAVAMDATGNFVIAWQSPDQDGSGDGVFAQRYNAAGVAQGTEFRVNTTTGSGQTRPAIDMDAVGDFVIAWESNKQDGDGSSVFAQRYNAAGIAQGSEFPVNTFTTDDQDSPVVAMDASGGFVIAWESDNQDGDLTGIYAQRYNAAGVVQGGEFPVNGFTEDSQQQPGIAMEVDGGFVIAWVGEDPLANRPAVFARRFTLTGVNRGIEFRVNDFSTFSPFAPSVAIDADGDFVVAWSSAEHDGDGEAVRAQRFDSAGVAIGAEFQVNTETVGDQLFPATVLDADGDFVIAWQSDQQDGDDDGIFAQRFAGPGLDFGDAPDPNFPSLLASNGARHTAGSLFLGTAIDSEADGQPDISATGDDFNTSDDEEGIAFSSLTASQPGSLGVFVSGGNSINGAGRIDAWIDFNRDGDWADAGEQIFDNRSVFSGSSALEFTVPASAIAGQTFARVRLSSPGVASFTGEAPNGEVEDVQLSIAPGVPPPPPGNVPKVGFITTVNDPTVKENAGTVEVKVRLSFASNQVVTVPIAFSGSAARPADYQTQATQAVFQPGNRTFTIRLNIVNDTKKEPKETIVLNLGTPTNAVKGNLTQRTVSIQASD